MSKRLVVVFAVCLVSLAVSKRAEAIYTRTSVPFAWRYSPNLETNISSQDDALSAPINLPFAFPFQDDVFTQIRIHTNGFVTLSNANPPCGGCFNISNLAPGGSVAAPDYMIAPWWADWNPAADGDIYYGQVDDAFVVEWWYVEPYGAAAGQTYAFSLHLFADGRFRFLYMTTNRGFASRDNGNTASIGYQGRSSAGFGESMLFATGSGGSLSDTTAYEFARASDNLNTAAFNLDASVPDIVERWAPVIWADVDQGEGRCDQLTSPTFDGDFAGYNNTSNASIYSSFSMPATVQYTVAYGATHTFIGYYFYHAFDCSDFTDGGGHEHDWEGVTIAVNNSTGQLDAVLSNTHGMEIPYHSPFDNSVTTLPHFTDSSDSPTFTYFSMRGLQGAYDTLGVGVEAKTHATWGRWHNRCVIGTSGSPSGCDDSHGGDGIVYTYGGAADTVGTVSQYPSWFTGSRVRYALRPLLDLYNVAQQSAYCGQVSPIALYACQSEGMPWDRMNSAGDDAADLPWVWGEYGVTTTACTDRNIALQPAFIFGRYFTWPVGRLNECSYTRNDFFNGTTACTPQPTCLGWLGPVSEESWKRSAVCGPNNTGIGAARCVGSYCDDIYASCVTTPGGVSASTTAGYWTGYFSDENPAKFCSPDGSGVNINGIIDGFQATGSYADNISVHCSAITAGHLTNCQWAGWFSEEQGTKDFGGKFAVGAQCSGSYCDNMNYYVCNLGP